APSILENTVSRQVLTDRSEWPQAYEASPTWADLLRQTKLTDLAYRKTQYIDEAGYITALKARRNSFARLLEAFEAKFHLINRNQEAKKLSISIETAEHVGKKMFSFHNMLAVNTDNLLVSSLDALAADPNAIDTYEPVTFDCAK